MRSFPSAAPNLGSTCSACFSLAAQFGASLASLARLGEQKGYSLVATNSTGVNAFFVRKDLVTEGRFLDPAVYYHYSPPQYGPDRGGHPEGHGPFLEI